ncbi:MAG: 3'-5' exonuclease, partial [Porticoccaceae bacterium]|nr:3'-5' exonuclease [Porticoccaceae bacterium]
IDDWASFQYAVNQLYAEPSADVEPLADEEPSAIEEPLASQESLAVEEPLADRDPITTGQKPPPLQIMTIHKSKGLEFDTVIIPGLDRRGANNSHELLLWRERVNRDGANQLLLSPPQKLGAADDALYTHLKREEGIKSRLENTRVLYVACTRAIERLHLLFRQPLKNPAAGSLLASAWPVLKDHVSVGSEGEPLLKIANCAVTLHPPSNVEGTEQLEEQAADAVTEQSYSFRLPANWRSPFTKEKASPSKNTSPAMANNKPPAITLPGASDPRKIGTLMHRTLRLLVIEGIEQWTPERIARQQSSWIIQIKQAGIIDKKTALAVLNEALEKCLADRAQHWIFDRNHEQSYCELALNYRDSQGHISSAIVDRCFIIDDTRWIVDYKTSLPAAEQSLEDFIQQQCNAYREQLSLYAQTLTHLRVDSANKAGNKQSCKSPVKLKAALYFPLLSHLQVVIEQ